MTKETIISKIEELFNPLPAACKMDLIAQSEVTHASKGTVLVKEGEYSDKMFFVFTGCLRAFYLKDGRDISDWFAFEGQFVCSIRSFFLDVPSEHHVEALEDSDLLIVNKETVALLSHKYREFEQIGTHSITQTMLSLQERIVSMQFKSARERYETLLDQVPGIDQRIALTHIASYLGVTLETISRIRSKVRI